MAKLVMILLMTLALLSCGKDDNSKNLTLNGPFSKKTSIISDENPEKVEPSRPKVSS